MTSAGRLLTLKFLPAYPDLALLVMRLWFGGLLVLLHGLMKISMWGPMSQRFADPFGIGSPASLALSIFAEAVCASLIALGLFTRFAAVVCIINMTTASRKASLKIEPTITVSAVDTITQPSSKFLQEPFIDSFSYSCTLEAINESLNVACQ